MTFNFTEEQIMIRDMVREFTKKEVEPRDKWMDENGFDYELHKKLTQAGLMGIHLDEKYGGGGGDAVTSIIVIHEIAKGSASEALFLDANWLAADLILYHGTEAQKDKYLPQAAQGKIFAFGLTESCAGSDAAGIKSTVVPADDGGWILNGGKAWITNSGVADYYIILAKTDPAAGNKGISAFIVPKDAEGLTIGKFEDKMGMRGSATCELSFDNIHLPADALLGSLGMGFKMAMQALDGARISIGAIAGMQIFRHKTKHASFRIGMPCILLVQLRQLPPYTSHTQTALQVLVNRNQIHLRNTYYEIPLYQYKQLHYHTCRQYLLRVLERYNFCRIQMPH